MPRPTLVLCLALLAAQPAIAAEAAEAPAAQPQATELLSPAETAAVDAVIAKAFAAGFPDLAGAALILGKVRLTTPEPVDGGAELDELMMGPVESSSSDGKLTLTIDGLHIRFADGRWLVAMHRLVAPGKDSSVVADDTAIAVARGRLAEELAKREERGSGEDGEDARFLDMFVAEDRERLARAVAAAKPFRSLEWSAAPHLTLGIVRHLQAADTAAMLVCMAAADTTPWMQSQQHGTTAPALNLGGGNWYGNAMPEIDYEAWQKEKNGSLRLPPADRGLAIAFSAWFQMLLTDAGALAAARLDAAKAAMAARDLLPEDLRATHGPAIDGLLARLAVPAKAPDGADLAARLQSWLPPSPYGMFGPDGEVPEITQEMLDSMPAEHRTQMQAMMDAAKAWKPTAGDLPGLLALLDDTRPARWLDQRTPRCVGDCALRAIAAILRFDPRLLVGRKPSAPWTAAERTATAGDLRAWWAKLAGRPLADGLAEAIPSLPPEAAVALLRATKVEQRQPLLDRLAAAWQATPPAQVPARELGAILGLAGAHAGVAAAVAKLPVDGALRPLLACWHDQAGQPGHIDAMLGELSAQAPADDAAASRLALVLAQAMRHPSPARLQTAVRLVGGPLDDRRTWAALSALSPRNQGGGEDWDAVMALNAEGSQRDGDEGAAAISRAIPLAVAAAALADRRALPDGLATWQIQDAWASVQLPGLHTWMHFGNQAREGTATERKPPAGLRVNDIAAMVIAGDAWSLGLQGMHGDEQRLDPWHTGDERDRTIRELATAVLEAARPALQAAKLPEVLPADLAAPAASDKALF